MHVVGMCRWVELRGVDLGFYLALCRCGYVVWARLGLAVEEIYSPDGQAVFIGYG